MSLGIHCQAKLDGTIDGLKACLVEKGYTQRYGMDFQDFLDSFSTQFYLFVDFDSYAFCLATIIA